ncbi:MAG TPA: Gfo/Idh/MocA family oxidoreductase [Tepidisphaeraceae bacterium]|jgi:predicted dehydrogenase
MTQKLRWGILGTGNIARQFAEGVRQSARGELAAVGSRSGESARAFAEQFNIPASHSSYAALLADSSYDALYISLPNTMHHEWTMEALQAGKHVLCEKPISVTADEAREMFAAALRSGRVLIEAFMYRAHPQTLRAVELVRSGAIGQLKSIRTSFCYRVRKIEGNIRFDATLAGGALMDVGCYCVSFSRLLAGAEPVRLHAASIRHPSGVDEQTSGLLEFPGGVSAIFNVGMMTQADNTAYICGDEGYLKISIPWKPPAGGGEVVQLQSTPPRQDNPNVLPKVPEPVIHRIAEERNVYAVEADAFAACVLDSAEPFVSEADTVGNMVALDALRSKIASQ